MFESDDFDQVLSQFDFPEVSSKVHPTEEGEANICERLEIKTNNSHESYKASTETLHNKKENNAQFSPLYMSGNNTDNGVLSGKNVNSDTVDISPKHTKRKIINTFFDNKSKRKFPGPAGLLTGNLEDAKDETICHMELLSQVHGITIRDIDFTQNRRDLFESPLWARLIDDTRSWNLCESDPIKSIKQQALAGNLRRGKAQTVRAFVETVDRSAIDPLIILRDTSGSIQCTLHRDAWSTFSPYIVSEYCALVLLKPTVLTRGSAFKKHYLTITLSNIYAIYSSGIFKDTDTPLPDGYTRIPVDGFTVIKTDISPQTFGSNLVSSNEPASDANDLLDGLDVSIFSDDLF